MPEPSRSKVPVTVVDANTQDCLRNVGIVTRGHLRRLTVELARTLKARHGSEIHLFCRSVTEPPYYEKLNGNKLFSSVNLVPPVLMDEYPTGLNAEKVMARARELECRYGVTINSLVMRNRSHGRGFAPGGYYHPRSRHSETVDYTQMAEAYNRHLTFWEKALAASGITLLLNGLAESAAVTRKMNIPFRCLIEARFKNHWVWAADENDRVPAIDRAFHRIERAGPPDALDMPMFGHLQNRAKLLRRAKLGGLVLWILELCKRKLMWHLTGYVKARGYYLRSEIKHAIRQWHDFGRMTGPGLAKLDDLIGKAFVFFPLHVEPERALQGISTEYFFQHAAILSVARDLPAGVVLALKEHVTAIGRRPANFYDQLRDLKNVVLVDAREFGLDIARHAAAVVTITGTAGFEAAVLGRPVITFGRHNNYNFLPHVRTVTREEELRGYLAEALNGGIDLERARRDGARFLAAVRTVGFDLKNYDCDNPEVVEDWMVEAAYQSLLESFAHEPEESAATAARAPAVTGRPTVPGRLGLGGN